MHGGPKRIRSTYKIRKRKRSSTSVEDLDSGTEARFDFEKRKALAAVDAEDEDYTSRNSEAGQLTS